MCGKADDSLFLSVCFFQVLGMIDLHEIINMRFFFAEPRHIHHFHGGHTDMFINLLQQLLGFRARDLKAGHDLLQTPVSLFGYAVHNAGAQKAPYRQDSFI